MSIAMAGVADTSRPRSTELYRRGQAVFPGGVTRATIERDPHPIYVARGEGAFVVDVDGHRLLDLNNNFTTLLHGHAFEPVIEAVAPALPIPPSTRSPWPSSWYRAFRRWKRSASSTPGRKR